MSLLHKRSRPRSVVVNLVVIRAARRGAADGAGPNGNSRIAVFEQGDRTSHVISDEDDTIGPAGLDRKTANGRPVDAEVEGTAGVTRLTRIRACIYLR